MYEYVKRETLRQAYERSFYKDNHQTREASAVHRQEHRHILHILETTPLIDAVEVVRCKDCKFARGIGCPFHEAVRDNENDYCSYGERKESGNQ